MSRFHNIIFDFDGLMVNSEPLHRRAFNMVLEACNADYAFDEKEYGERFSGVPVIENAEYIRERFALPQTAEALANGQRALFTILISDAENLEPMPGLVELIHHLHDSEHHHFRIAIASSSFPAHLELILRGLNLVHQFDVVVGGDGKMRNKPAPDVYLRAIELIGANPAETLALEDSNSGVRAAKAAGLFVIAVPNVYTQGQNLSMADLQLSDLHQVRAFIEKSEIQNLS
jgi:HAD superfamily hydrolase (TIGR01509 family)